MCLLWEEEDEGLRGAGVCLGSRGWLRDAWKVLRPSLLIPRSARSLLYVIWGRRGRGSHSLGCSVPICQVEMLIGLSS